MIHVYHGDGKGKTTAAVGLAVRAAGAGKKVLFIQFLKGRESAEVELLKGLGISVLRLDRDYGFWKHMSEETKMEVSRQHDLFLREAVEKAACGQVDVLALDEIVGACSHQMADPEMLQQLLDEAAARKDSLEVICTGRLPADSSPNETLACMLDLADYVTQMKKEKHPYDQGIAARKGIEW